MNLYPEPFGCRTTSCIFCSRYRTIYITTNRLSMRINILQYLTPEEKKKKKSPRNHTARPASQYSTKGVPNQEEPTLSPIPQVPRALRQPPIPYNLYSLRRHIQAFRLIGAAAAFSVTTQYNVLSTLACRRDAADGALGAPFQRA